MVAIIFDYEVAVSAPPARMFKALTLHGNVIPDVLPKGVKSIQILEGDGGVGTIHLITFGEGSLLKATKDRIDGIDKDELSYTFTTIGVEGGIKELDNIIESVSNFIKFQPSSDGGSICKAICTYNTKGDAQVTEEQVRGKDRVTFHVQEH